MPLRFAILNADINPNPSKPSAKPRNLKRLLSPPIKILRYPAKRIYLHSGIPDYPAFQLTYGLWVMYSLNISNLVVVVVHLVYLNMNPTRILGVWWHIVVMRKPNQKDPWCSILKP